ncbi:Meiosis inhibitor protein 1 [Holothuria leucospilota]|uniref:Meiosis inhibitor protein 1 n=1 Tax=Holothuria leucospilota TaxID=206669 RepID=A0A9Q1H8X5_HOLLE|nr:Meiosis inhibitor protein 1 [Holothuria leucospilota]
MLSYLTSVLLLASSSGDSRVASVMLSSESLLRYLHQRATEKPSSSLEVIFTARSKLKYQSVFLTAYLVAASAKFKIKPEVSLLWDVETLFACLTKSDVCAKVSSLQLLTSVFEMNFESQVIQIRDKPQQRTRSSDDVGLVLSAGTTRSLFFLLQNILLRGSDFVAWNSLLCLSSLWEYVSKKNKKVSDHLVQQPWNEFLVESCLGFYGDTLPPAWFIRFLILFPSQVPQKSVEAILNSILQQNPETLDHRMLGSAAVFIKEPYRYIGGVVLSADLTFLDRTADLARTICGLGM